MAPTTGRPDTSCAPSAHTPTGTAGSGSRSGTIAVIMDFAPMTTRGYHRLIEKMELGRTAQGLSRPVFHWVKEHPDRIRVIEIWAAFQPLMSFMRSVLQPLMRDLGLPEPKWTFHDVPDHLMVSEADVDEQVQVRHSDPFLTR